MSDTPAPDEDIRPIELYSESDVARLLGISPRTLAAWRRVGHGPKRWFHVVERGRYRGAWKRRSTSVMYEVSDVDAYIESGWERDCP